MESGKKESWINKLIKTPGREKEAIEKLEGKPDDDLIPYLQVAEENGNIEVIKYIIDTRGVWEWAYVLANFTEKEDKVNISYIVENNKAKYYDDTPMTWDNYLCVVVGKGNLSLFRWITETNKSTDYIGAFRSLRFGFKESPDVIQIMKTLQMKMNLYPYDDYIQAIGFVISYGGVKFNIALLLLQDVPSDKLNIKAFQSIKFFKDDENKNTESIKLMEYLKKEIKPTSEHDYKLTYFMLIRFGHVTCEVVDLILKDVKDIDEIITEVICDDISSEDPNIFGYLFSKLNLTNINKLTLLSSIMGLEDEKSIKIVVNSPEFLPIVSDAFSYLAVRDIKKAQKLMDIDVKINGNDVIEKVALDGEIDFIENILKHNNVSISDKEQLLQITRGENPNVEHDTTAFLLACMYKNIPFLQRDLSKIPTHLIQRVLDRAAAPVEAQYVSSDRPPVASVVEYTDVTYLSVLVEEKERRNLLPPERVIEEKDVAKRREEKEARQKERAKEKEARQKSKEIERAKEKEMRTERRKQLWQKIVNFRPFIRTKP
jgi:hypothetical protein